MLPAGASAQQGPGNNWAQSGGTAEDARQRRVVHRRGVLRNEFLDLNSGHALHCRKALLVMIPSERKWPRFQRRRPNWARCNCGSNAALFCTGGMTFSRIICGRERRPGGLAIRTARRDGPVPPLFKNASQIKKVTAKKLVAVGRCKARKSIHHCKIQSRNHGPLAGSGTPCVFSQKNPTSELQGTVRSTAGVCAHRHCPYSFPFYTAAVHLQNARDAVLYL